MRLLAFAVVAAGLAGCASDFVPPPPVNKPGPEWSDRETRVDRGPGMLGDLRWNIDLNTGKRESVSASQRSAPPASAAEQEEFKKWQESAGSTQRKEFEDWRAWQEWKRQNPK